METFTKRTEKTEHTHPGEARGAFFDRGAWAGYPRNIEEKPPT